MGPGKQGNWVVFGYAKPGTRPVNETAGGSYTDKQKIGEGFVGREGMARYV